MYYTKIKQNCRNWTKIEKWEFQLHENEISLYNIYNLRLRQLSMSNLISVLADKILCVDFRTKLLQYSSDVSKIYANALQCTYKCTQYMQTYKYMLRIESLFIFRTRFQTSWGNNAIFILYENDRFLHC